MNNTVVACVDGSPSTGPVCDYAAWAAAGLSAPLAKVRSAVVAGTVLASGASPVIMGVLIDNHITLRVQALLCLVFILAASLVATRVRAGVPENETDISG